MEENREELLEQLMPRLTELSEQLENIGIESDVLMAMESLPAVLAEAEGRQIRLTYVPVEADGYLLSITAASEPQEAGEVSTLELCDRFNENSLLAMACLEPLENKVIFKCGVPEAGEIADSRQLQFILDLFMKDVHWYESQAEAWEAI